MVSKESLEFHKLLTKREWLTYLFLTSWIVIFSIYPKPEVAFSSFSIVGLINRYIVSRNLSKTIKDRLGKALPISFASIPIWDYRIFCSLCEDYASFIIDLFFVLSITLAYLISREIYYLLIIPIPLATAYLEFRMFKGLMSEWILSKL